MRIVISIEVDAIKSDAIEIAEGLHQTVQSITGLLPMNTVVSTNVDDATDPDTDNYNSFGILEHMVES